MNIVTSNSELTKIETYKMTIAPNIKKMSSMKGQRIEFDKFCIYIDKDREGNEQQIISILTPEGETYATNSKTFIESFNKIVDVFGVDGFNAITVSTGTSKAGREYINAVYAE